MTQSDTKLESVLVLDKYEDSDWKELPPWVQEAAGALGYTKKLWNKDKEPDVLDQDWRDLTDSQRKAAEKLGYTQQAWDDETDDESMKSSSSSSSDEDEPEAVLVLDKYEDSDWQELPEWVQEAAGALGYTKKLWNKDKEPDTLDEDWEDLTDTQREAAKKLGYTQKAWDAEEPTAPTICLADAHKHLNWTIYCIQLYNETEDYQFRISEETGICMHTNRPVEANESIIRSPVGPDIWKELFEVPQNGVVSDERKGFAKRFMEWQDSFLQTERVGAQNGAITIALEDFSNVPITSKEHRAMPSNESFVYDMGIFEHEIVIAEFISPPSKPDYELPAARRFEILHYGEALVGEDGGEEGYDPAVMNRPPTLAGLEMRHLELPGHFTNHASGATATCFSFFDPGSVDQFPLPPGEDLPDWLAKELDASKNASEKDMLYPTLMPRVAVPIGTNITTDYTFWHYSGGDYHGGPSRKTPIGYFLGDDSNSDRWDWNELSPKIKRAALILGFTEALWESEETPPTFEKSWRRLSLQEQDAVINLTGHNEKSWNKDKDTEGDPAPVASVFDLELEWADLSEEQKKAAAIIGHTESTWNEGDPADIFDDELYYYSYRPEVRDAMVVLGETEATWEKEKSDEKGQAEEAWFYCLCGDSDCHSSKERGGFRGVEYFELERQIMVAPFCGTWVQQQILWKLYQLKHPLISETAEKPEKKRKMEA